MKIVEIDTDKFNKLRPDGREIFTDRSQSGGRCAVVWAKGWDAEVLYKYKCPNKIRWIIEAKEGK